MATQITRDGGFLKVVVDTNKPKYFCLGKLEVSIEGDLTYLMDGNSVNFNDVSIPTVTSSEELADEIGGYVFEYNTGQ